MNAIAGFLKSKRGIICVAVAATLLVAGGTAFGAYEYWLYGQPKFHDVTIELGTDTVSISDFMTEYAKLSKSTFVTDVSTVDLNKTGDISLTLAHGKKEETVTLSIVDTTAPTVEFVTSRTETLDYEPAPEDFVASIQDFSTTTVTFAEEETGGTATGTDAAENADSTAADAETAENGTAESEDPDTATATDAEASAAEDAADALPAYADKTFTVLVTDASGNVTGAECELHYEWLLSALTLELGEKLSKADLLIKEGVGEELIADEDVTAVNTGGVGEYVIESTLGERTEACTVTVQDTVAPELTLQEIHIYTNETASLEDFVVSASDISGEVELRLMSELPIGVVGVYTVTIEAEDASGNITSADTVFEVKADDIAPVISGLSDITHYLGTAAPNYKNGVTATDNIDGTLEFSYDDSAVDLETAGTYYVIYTASDVEGNVATEKRKITVKKDDVAPEISGLSDLSVEKNGSKPNYLSGVTATDNVDGTVEVTYSDSSVDYSTTGTYYVVYTATDAAGNTTTKKRKVTVANGLDDTSLLVASIAESLSDDPVTIKNYVKNLIKYNHDYGGSDPVYYGFTKKVGNCYVHAMCLKAIFDYKGIESRLIWTTQKTHYWLIVKADGKWWHIDATPGTQHQKYSGLMTDAQRLSTLSGRTWDTSLWPSCG